MVCIYLAGSLFTVCCGCGVKGQIASGVLVLDFSALFGFPWIFKVGAGALRVTPVLQRWAVNVMLRPVEGGIL